MRIHSAKAQQSRECDNRKTMLDIAREQSNSEVTVKKTLLIASSAECTSVRYCYHLLRTDNVHVMCKSLDVL